jgi:uncharacterized RDD family membrane protein YckC
MKCPKCGYLGFETTDRCRNCQYDFSLASAVSQPDLTLHDADRDDESPGDFDLAPIKRQTDKLSTTALDLDRLFGDAEQRQTPAAPPAVATRASIADEHPPEAADEDPNAGIATFVPKLYEPEALEPEPPAKPTPLRDVTTSVDGGTRFAQVDEPTGPAAVDEVALPFDDGPLVPPPAARPPLAVRRSTPELPRNRPRTTRPVRSFDFESGATKSGDAARDASETIASLMEPPSLGARVGSGLIDFTLLLAIDLTVLYLTLRVTGLDNSLADVLVLPPVPFIGFLALLAFGYMAAFTVAGGQTIGKMMFGLRVIGDDGRPVDTAGGVIRALGCLLVPLTLGLSYLPALFTSDHRALHDRLAGTRVVRE